VKKQEIVFKEKKNFFRPRPPGGLYSKNGHFHPLSGRTEEEFGPGIKGNERRGRIFPGGASFSREATQPPFLGFGGPEGLIFRDRPRRRGNVGAQTPAPRFFRGGGECLGVANKKTRFALAQRALPARGGGKISAGTGFVYGRRLVFWFWAKKTEKNQGCFFRAAGTGGDNHQGGKACEGKRFWLGMFRFSFTVR